MRPVHYILAILILSCSISSAQNCDWNLVPGQNGDPEILELLTGNRTRAGKDYLMKRADVFLLQKSQNPVENRLMHQLRAGAYPEAAITLNQLFPTDTSDAEPDSMRIVANAPYVGMYELLSGNYAEAASAFRNSRIKDAGARDCGVGMYELIASYLQQYDKGQSPLFGHFNGGFYSYLKAELYWGKDEKDTLALAQATTVAMRLLAYKDGNSIIFLEVLADLVANHQDRFIANYLGGLAYMRAAQMATDPAASQQFEEKAIYALEAPRTGYNKFNRYRFTQLKKTLIADVEVAEAARTQYLSEEKAAGNALAEIAKKWSAGAAAPPIRFYSEQTKGELGGKLTGARSKEASRAAADKKFAEEVDLKTVKEDSRFNTYAILLILVLIGAVIFIWRKYAAASKTR